MAIFMRGSLHMLSFQPITSHTRVTRDHGDALKCPRCDYVQSVYHLSWVALQCSHCKTMVNKEDFTILKPNKSSQNRLQGACNPTCDI